MCVRGWRKYRDRPEFLVEETVGFAKTHGAENHEAPIDGAHQAGLWLAQQAVESASIELVSKTLPSLTGDVL